MGLLALRETPETGEERVATELIDTLGQVQTVYEQDRSGELRERLRGMTIKEAMGFTGLSRRQVFYLRAGR